MQGLLLYYAFSLQPDEAPTDPRISVYDAFSAPGKLAALLKLQAFAIRDEGHSLSLHFPLSLSHSCSVFAANPFMLTRRPMNGKDSLATTEIDSRAPGQAARWEVGEEDRVSFLYLAPFFLGSMLTSR